MSEPATPLDLLKTWLRRALPAPAWSWLEERLAALSGEVADRDLYLAISLVPRRLGKADLELDAGDLAAAEAARSGWRPDGWSVDQAARIALLLATAGGPAERFARHLDQLCTTADVAELVAFYRGLPLYPAPERHRARAGEGARTNMKAVFEAVAHHNPYPGEQFDEGTWNHMVLKALFIGSALHPIQGLERRANPGLMRMLCDYAHERWAASRPVSPELWRCVGPYADEAALADLARVLDAGGEGERQAAALALAGCPYPGARVLLERRPDLAAAVDSGGVTWERVAKHRE